MGLHGIGAAVRKRAAEQKSKSRRYLPWEKKGLTRDERVIAFLEWLPVSKGILAGRRMKLLPEQKKFVREVYGPRRADGRRLRRVAILSEPKGNGKTGLVAGLALCHMCGPEAEPRGEVYSAAKSREQASIIFEELEATILRVPEFARRLNVQRFKSKIEDLENGTKYEALSSDARTAHGKAPSVWIYDELAQAPDGDLLTNLMQGMGKRKEPLGIILSTQAPTDDHALSQLIDDGLTSTDPKTYVQLICAPPDADPFDIEVIKACNPAFGKFLDLDDLMEKRELAMRLPAWEPSFRNLRLNQRVDSRADDRVVTRTVWQANAKTVNRKALKGRLAFGGLDLSGKHDLSALVLAFPDNNGAFDLLPLFWTPRDALEARKPQERDMFKQWIKQGFIREVPGPIIRFEFIAAEIAKLVVEFDIRAIGYDRWRIDEFKPLLSDENVQLANAEKKQPGLILEPFGQGFKDMGPAVEHFADLALTGMLRHGGNPVLTSSVANAIVVQDPAGNKKFDKDKANKSASVRIDGAVATTMALGTAKRHLGNKQPASINEFLAQPVMVV